MALVTAKEIAKALNLHQLGFLGQGVAWLIFRLLGFKKLNNIYKKNQKKTGIHFLKDVLEDCNIQFTIPEQELKRIPKKGAFIIISNHPLGGVDGLLLLKLALQQRADFKIIANFLLLKIAPLKNYIFPVNPFETRKNIISSVTGIKNALLHLKEGKPLGVFPAGEVSTIQKEKLVLDKPWDEGALRFIKKAKVPVIPIYFHTKNSTLFYVLSKISGTLRTAKLPSELKSNVPKLVKIRIGKPITVADQNECTDTTSFGCFLRKKTYLLANPFLKKQKLIPIPKISNTIKKTTEITRQKEITLLLQEITSLREAKKQLFTSKNYEVYFAAAKEIPTLLHEIGRLREITFRTIGEGTNAATDLDKYDNYYHHLFLWDHTKNLVVGAYRIGLGKEIFKKYGSNGFYIQTLFTIDAALNTMMQSSIEMGRAFVIQEYQKKPMPLFLLWKGIVHLTLRFSEYEYLIGSVSISNTFSDFTKSLMIEFMRSHYYDSYLAQYIRPKKAYKVKLKDVDKDFVFDISNGNLQKFDKIIDEIEPGTLRIPVLLKKYIKQNARLLGFNIDPKFNNALDALMYINIRDIPESTVKPVIEEFQKTLKIKKET